ncbi:hypothetical protein F5Y11DRAFT_99069 [Daldinia sp. FL1419]|nr:hypothetical protein F5Y11DRAFT_99069 [Daldinia sp. FL1419]
MFICFGDFLGTDWDWKSISLWVVLVVLAILPHVCRVEAQRQRVTLFFFFFFFINGAGGFLRGRDGDGSRVAYIVHEEFCYSLEVWSSILLYRILCYSFIPILFLDIARWICR